MSDGVNAPAEAVRVLIVDDNRDFAENLAGLAQLQGLETNVAHDGRTALALAAERPFDVAIVDQKLPDAVGTELLAELRRRLPDVVALVVTAFVSLDNSLAALNEGAFAFVAKDADPEELVSVIGRAAENARLRRENRGLRDLQSAILESLPVFLLLVDEEFVVQSVNGRNDVFCPGDPSTARGRPVEDVVAPFVRARLDLRAWLQEALRAGALAAVEGSPGGRVTPGARMLELRDAEGRPRIFELTATPLAHGPRRLTLVRAAELTDQILLERRLTETEHLAALGRLVSSIAHEVRNPLAGIRALAQLLERSLKRSARDHENVVEILALTDRMHATLSDLLEFARPGVRREETIEVGALLESLVAEARRWPAAEDRQIELRHLSARPFELSAARDRLTGLFANLLDNALHAAPASGRVRVACHGDGTTFVVDVEDDGPGIPDDVKPRLFQPFFTTKTRGTGLGLSIVKKYVDALGGSVEAGSSKDLGGARFTVRLPAPAR